MHSCANGSTLFGGIPASHGLFESILPIILPLIGLRCEPSWKRSVLMSQQCSKNRAILAVSSTPLACIDELIAEPKTMARFLSLFLQKLCPHQVCVICGTAYEYDWTTMRRVRRLTTPLSG
jgi:hypothetical protein